MPAVIGLVLLVAVWLIAQLLIAWAKVPLTRRQAAALQAALLPAPWTFVAVANRRGSLYVAGVALFLFVLGYALAERFRYFGTLTDPLRERDDR